MDGRGGVVVEKDDLGPDSLKGLEVWNEAMELVKDVYGLVRNWPAEELYGLTSQARRAAISVPANLAEGVGRGTPGEKSRFAHTALGSLYELDTLIQLAGRLGYSAPKVIEEIRSRIIALVKRLQMYVRYQEGRR